MTAILADYDEATMTANPTMAREGGIR
ncbi:hypothetical protein FB33_0525 [Cutibacterium acnes]|nr:hypothetical protein FB33_0525 [Cutibacterium acnes]